MTEKSKLTEELMREYGLSDEPRDETKPAPDASLAPNEAVVGQPSGGGNPFVELKRKQAEAESKKPPKTEFERNPELTGLGAFLGGVSQYKGLGTDILKPAPDLFVHRDSNIPSGQKSPLIPVAGEPMTDVEHTMQSGQGKRPSETGRQREDTHNWESNRRALVQEQQQKSPAVKELIVQAGPQYATESGLAIPKSTAVELEQELQLKQAAEAEQRRQLLAKQEAEAKRVQAQKAKIDQIKGVSKGTARIGQGVFGGALAAPALYEYGRDVVRGDKNKPADVTQGLSGLGGVMMALGKFKGMGGLGAALQAPYVIKNRDEIARSQLMSDVVPDVIRMGMTGSELYEPANQVPVKPTPIQ